MKELPSIALNGVDNFMLAMDRSMRASGSRGNICHLIITLRPDADLSTAGLRLLAHPTFRAVTSLRLKTGLLLSRRWVSCAAPPTQLKTIRECRSDQELHALILARSLDIAHESPFGVTPLPNYTNGPSLLFYWHHALCDAHGGERLVKALAETTTGDIVGALTPSNESLPPVKERLLRAHKVKRMIFEKARGGISRLAPAPKGASAPRFHLHTFSPEETRSIERTIGHLTGGMFPTAVCLAATARAFASATSVGTSSTEPLFVPVPHDIRRSSKQQSPLTNQVSVAFFRVSSPLERSLASVSNEIIQQLHDSVAEGYHHGMIDFFRLIRRLPLSLMWRVIESPTKGHPASFYYSDIGSSLSSLAVFDGSPVARATHYPPVLSPPGFTAVWSKYRDSLEVAFCFDGEVLNDTALARITQHLSNDLIRGEDDHRSL